MNKVLVEQICILKKIIEDQHNQIKLLETEIETEKINKNKRFFINVCCKCGTLGNKIMYDCAICIKKICCDCCFININKIVFCCNNCEKK